MRFASRVRTVALLLALWFVIGGGLQTARADEVVFPKGLRVGLVPLEGLSAATAFPGFEATDQRIKVIVTELPKNAFDSVQAAVKDNHPMSSGQPSIEPFELASGAKAYITHETATDNGGAVRRFSILVGSADFSGYVAVQVPDNAGDGFSDQAIRKMLSSVTLRTSVPLEEQLDRLPFKLADTAGFKSIRALPSGTVLLTDATDDAGLEGAPYVLIGVMPEGPATPDDRDRFAQEIARTLPGLREIRIMSSEPQRIEGLAGYETRLEAVTGKNNTPVRIVQWLRFSNSPATLRIVAGAKRDEWQPAFVRFRAVRDGIGPR